MARQTGLSKSSVQRLWSAHQLQPHRVRHFVAARCARVACAAIEVTIDAQSSVRTLRTTEAKISGERVRVSDERNSRDNFFRMLR
jgi:hypothetical protein